MAKGFGEYSGVSKTPGSLCWLIRHRAWIDGRINQLEKVLESVPEELSRLRDQLAAIDRTMALHDIKVDPSLIKPVRKKKPRLAPYGGLSRMLLTSLRLARGTRQTTSELALYVLRELKMPFTRANQSQVRRVVITQLNNLRSRQLIAGEVPDGERESVWWLAPAIEQYAPRPSGRKRR